VARQRVWELGFRSDVPWLQPAVETRGVGKGERAVTALRTGRQADEQRAGWDSGALR